MLITAWSSFRACARAASITTRLSVAPFSCHVVHVICVRAEAQMINSTTRCPVADMHYAKTLIISTTWYLAVSNHPRNTVRVNHLPAHSKTSITSLVLVVSPHPTLPKPHIMRVCLVRQWTIFINFEPEISDLAFCKLDFSSGAWHGWCSFVHGVFVNVS